MLNIRMLLQVEFLSSQCTKSMTSIEQMNIYQSNASFIRLGDDSTGLWMGCLTLEIKYTQPLFDYAVFFPVFNLLLWILCIYVLSSNMAASMHTCKTSACAHAAM